MIPFSVVIPAHNEEAVIGRLLEALTTGAADDEIDVVVAANGCRDATVAIARAAGPAVTVVEVEPASKIAALNAGDEAAAHFPRFYVDADVVVTLDTLRRCAEELVHGGRPCVAPRADFDLDQSSWAVKRFYGIWPQIPYFRESRIGMVYGLSAAGRRRFDQFPDITADDQFVAQTFAAEERACLDDCSFTVHPPRTLRSLLANRTRIYRGNLELAASGLARHPPADGGRRALVAMAARPANWTGLAIYLGVNALAKRRARRPHTGWERDDTSRPAVTRPTIGYVVSQYPARSHTFVLREVRALRALGASIDTFSIHAATDDELISSLDVEAAASTFALRPVTVGGLARRHLGALARHPGAYISTLAYALNASPPGLRARIWQAFYFAEAVLLHAEADRRGIQHLHAHLANAGADVAWLAAELGRRSDPSGSWRWSFTMHGPTEFFAVERFNLARKVAAAETVVCISDYCRSQLMLISDPACWSKLEVVHCGVDTAEFAFRAQPTKESGACTILCVGRLTPEKGQHILLEAVSRLRDYSDDVVVELVGWGPSESDLRAAARRLGIEDRVIFRGPIGQDRLAGLFAAADAFCLPSFAEGVPVVLMEAMATGLPVVTSPIAGIPELVRDGETGRLVPPGRADLLAAALHDLIEDPEAARRMAAAGRLVVEKEYDLMTNGRLLLEVLAG